MKFVYVFAVLGFCSVFWSCAQALSARLSDKYSDEKSIPFYLNWLFYICAFLGIFGVFAHPFETYLNNRFYDHMMKRVRAARFLAELTNYPPDWQCESYGLSVPTPQARQDLFEYFAAEDKCRLFSAKNGIPFTAPLRDHEALDDFKSWRNHEYAKLGL